MAKLKQQSKQCITEDNRLGQELLTCNSLVRVQLIQAIRSQTLVSKRCQLCNNI